MTRVGWEGWRNPIWRTVIIKIILCRLQIDKKIFQASSVATYSKPINRQENSQNWKIRPTGTCAHNILVPIYPGSQWSMKSCNFYFRFNGIFGQSFKDARAGPDLRFLVEFSMLHQDLKLSLAYLLAEVNILLERGIFIFVHWECSVPAPLSGSRSGS